MTSRTRLFVRFSIALLLLSGLLGMAQTKTELESTPAPWLQVDIGIIGTASEDILKAAMEQVTHEKLSGLIMVLDTPGGALDNTRTMVKDMMGANFPIIVWVGPSGSRAGSAGAFITIAAHIAAMAPGTNIGAAHPVDISGQDIGEEMQRKVTSDTIAFMESIAHARGRNVDMARSFVATSASVTENEALEHHIIDLVAQDIPTLLKSAHGKTIKLHTNETLVLDTNQAKTKQFKKSPRQGLLEILSNPNFFYILFLAGLIGLGYELTHPGILLPGIAGAICLILAFIAMSILPISYGAIALIFLGIALLIAEAFVPSFGCLGVGGLISFVIGSVFLVDPANQQGLRISWYAIAPGALTIGAAFLGLGFLVLRSEKTPIKSGREGLKGQKGVALSDFVSRQGQVRVAGAIWSAKAEANCPEPILKDDKVIVTKVKGLVLTVNKSDDVS